jgi:hypothetical protein
MDIWLVLSEKKQLLFDKKTNKTENKKIHIPKIVLLLIFFIISESEPLLFKSIRKMNFNWE